MPQTLEKYLDEDIQYEFDFSNNLNVGEVITAVTEAAVTVPAHGGGLTVDEATHSGTSVQFRVSGGQTKYKYDITVTVTTSHNNVRVGRGKIKVLE